MNRRTFFQRTVGAILAAPFVAPVVRWKSRLWTASPVVGIATEPIAKDAYGWVQTTHIAPNRIYFLNADGPWLVTRKGTERLWSDL